LLLLFCCCCCCCPHCCFSRRALPPEDPILTIARNTAASLDLLCLDELHVTDVADAMLLGRLFDGLLRGGVCVVFTSNRPARELYKGGLSRTYFEPFIHLVDERWVGGGGGRLMFVWVGGGSAVSKGVKGRACGGQLGQVS
jgi:hypothetical protein